MRGALHEPTNPGLRDWKRNSLRALVLVAGMTANINILNETEPADIDKQREAHQMARASKIPKKEEKRDACGVLELKHDILKKRYFNRRDILDRLAILGKCTDPNAVEFNFGDVCTQIERGIRDSRSNLRHPILHPFYMMLYQELQCRMRQDRENATPEVLKLFDTLNDSDIVRKYRLLDPTRSVDEVCREAVAFANASREEIADLQQYVLTKYDKRALEKSPHLKDLVEAAKETYRGKNAGKEPTNTDLAATLHAIFGYVATAAAHPMLTCFNPEATIKLMNPNLTTEALTEKRRLAFPALRELVDLVRSDTDHAAANKASNAILKLAGRMNRPTRN